MATRRKRLQPPDWANLPPELLGRVMARLPFPDDLARLRAVCRPWRSAVREHVGPDTPWLIHSDGSFVTTHDHRLHRRSILPDGTTFIGADGSWLALYRTNAASDGGRRRSYLLHNPFTKATVPLPGLDAVIGKVSDLFEIRKVLLLRSDDDDDGGDLVAVMTNSHNKPIILCRPGKPGAWIPEEEDRDIVPYASICDIAFHMGCLYGITYDMELLELDLGEDADGTPYVRFVGCAIDYMPDGDDVYVQDDQVNGYDGEAWGNEDGEEEAGYSDASSSDDDYEDDDGEASSGGDDDGEEALFIVNGAFEDVMSMDTNFFMSDDDQEDTSSSGDEDDDDATSNISEEEDDDIYYEGGALMRDTREVDDDEDGDYECVGDDMTRKRKKYIAVTTRCLIEANGKLLMLRRREHVYHSTQRYTSKVEVLEADICANEWVPTDVTGAIYVSERHSKHISALGTEEDGLNSYFADEHDCILGSTSTWFFPQELVIS